MIAYGSNFMLTVVRAAARTLSMRRVGRDLPTTPPDQRSCIKDCYPCEPSLQASVWNFLLE
jgi:hypothetical protein